MCGSFEPGFEPGFKLGSNRVQISFWDKKNVPGSFEPGFEPGFKLGSNCIFGKENEPESFEPWFDAGFKPGSNSFGDMNMCLGAANIGFNNDQISCKKQRSRACDLWKKLESNFEFGFKAPV